MNLDGKLEKLLGKKACIKSVFHQATGEIQLTLKDSCVRLAVKGGERYKRR